MHVGSGISMTYLINFSKSKSSSDEDLATGAGVGVAFVLPRGYITTPAAEPNVRIASWMLVPSQKSKERATYDMRGHLFAENCVS